MDKIQTRKPNDRSSYKTKAKSSTDKKQKNKTKKQECRAMSGVTMFLEFSSYNWDWKHFLWDEEIKPSSWVETGVALRPAFMGGAWKKLLLPAALEQGGGLGWLTSTSGKKKKKNQTWFVMFIVHGINTLRVADFKWPVQCHWSRSGSTPTCSVSTTQIRELYATTEQGREWYGAR